jgi:hypothetical protein
MSETDPSGLERGDGHYAELHQTFMSGVSGEMMGDPYETGGVDFGGDVWGFSFGMEGIYSPSMTPSGGNLCCVGGGGGTIGGGSVWDTGIMSYHPDASGTLVGDSPGEQDCATNNGCMVWDPNLQMWETPGEADVYPPMAQGVFQGYQRVFSAANQITDPRTIALWYVAAAAPGIASNIGEVSAAVNDVWLSVEVAFPGTTAATVDVLNVLSPSPSNVSTWVGVGAEVWNVYQWYQDQH